eukprot:TRINITY_DN2523_c0_g1_i2.p1 TRINITY_DN2523_c0_g1~~TRINITY_DN2523_c0_g1_i2.p1  ORF type:complete len:193 (+),score=23.80 TRINITY_DN2523_c0_g1_i2:65-643(+)
MQRVQLGFLAVFVLFALSSVFSVEDANYEYVTCHSVIKLAHQATGFRLHSHEVSYGNSGSGQQSVTGFPHNDDPNSLWLVKARHGQVCKNGERIKSGSVIRLEHVNTRKNLHSHNHRSPLSQSQEVSAYAPTKGEGDLGKFEIRSCGYKYTSNVPFLSCFQSKSCPNDIYLSPPSPSQDWFVSLGVHRLFDL